MNEDEEVNKLMEEDTTEYGRRKSPGGRGSYIS